jgi:hypothetical protein
VQRHLQTSAWDRWEDFFLFSDNCIGQPSMT